MECTNLTNNAIGELENAISSIEQVICLRRKQKQSYSKFTAVIREVNELKKVLSTLS